MALIRPKDETAATSVAVGDVFLIDGTTGVRALANAAVPSVAVGKTAVFSNSLTLAGTDGTVMTFPTTSATLARTDAANTFTGTQTVGALVATTINGNTFTAGTGVLTIGAGKTLTANNSLAFTGTDGTVMTFPTTSATIARTDAANTFTGTQTVGALVATTINGNTFTAGTGVLTIAAAKTLTVSNSLTLAGTDGTVQTFPSTTGTVVTSVSVNAVTNAMRSQMAAYTLKGNSTGSTANESDIDITALTSKASPVSGDILLIQDSAASNAFKKTTVGAVASAGSVASIAGNTGAFTLTGGITNSTNAIQVDGSFGFRNRVINPSGQINQGGVGSQTDATYDFDQWLTLTQTAAVTVSQLTAVENGTPYMMRSLQAQAAAQRFGRVQWLEKENCIDLRGQAVVLSARVRMSASTTLRYAIVEWTGTADTITKDLVLDWTSGTFTAGNFFTTTSTTVTATGSTALTANTLTTVSLTGTIGSSANNIAVFFWTDSTQAQNVTLDVGKVQLEVGVAATALALRSIAIETLLCQRYYVLYSIGAGNLTLGTGVINATNTAYILPTFTVPMRVAPTMTASSGSAILFGAAAGNFTSSAVVFSNISTTSATIQATIAGATAGQAALGLVPTGNSITVNARL